MSSAVIPNTRLAGTRLIFVGDPMCSWCYGFGKELSLLSERYPDLPVDILVGGVQAGATEPMSEEMKRFRLSHWHRVEKASGLPFNRETFMQRQGYVYDTEPACRAIVALRRVAPESSQLAVFRAIQHAFYAEGRDTSDGVVLADIVSTALSFQGFSVNPETFLAAWRDADIIGATAAEFKAVRNWGIRSFPTLLLDRAGQITVLAPGYMSMDEMDEHLSAMLAATSGWHAG
jgi:putative protein-disulfide isomerase